MCKTKTIASKKNFFSSNHQFNCWSFKSPMKVPWRSRTLGPSGDVPGTSLAGWEESCQELTTKTPEFTDQKMKFSIKDFFSKCYQMRNFLRIWSHLLKKSLIEILIFCELIMSTTMLFYLYCQLLTLLQCLQAGICFLGPNHRGCLCIMKNKLNIQRSYNSWPIVTVVEGK